MKIKSVIAIFFAMLLGLAVATKVVAKTTIKTDHKVFNTDDGDDDYEDEDDEDEDEDEDDDDDDDDWLEEDEEDEE